MSQSRNKHPTSKTEINFWQRKIFLACLKLIFVCGRCDISIYLPLPAKKKKSHEQCFTRLRPGVRGIFSITAWCLRMYKANTLVTSCHSVSFLSWVCTTVMSCTKKANVKKQQQSFSFKLLSRPIVNDNMEYNIPIESNTLISYECTLLVVSQKAPNDFTLKQEENMYHDAVGTRECWGFLYSYYTNV